MRRVTVSLALVGDISSILSEAGLDSVTTGLFALAMGADIGATGGNQGSRRIGIRNGLRSNGRWQDKKA